METGVEDSVGLGLDGTETVANPRAGLEAGFFFFLLLGGMVVRSKEGKAGCKVSRRGGQGEVSNDRK